MGGRLAYENADETTTRAYIQLFIQYSDLLKYSTDYSDPEELRVVPTQKNYVLI